jgi:hypothetical protein
MSCAITGTSSRLAARILKSGVMRQDGGLSSLDKPQGRGIEWQRNFSLAALL